MYITPMDESWTTFTNVKESCIPRLAHRVQNNFHTVWYLNSCNLSVAHQKYWLVGIYNNIGENDQHEKSFTIFFFFFKFYLFLYL